MIHIENIMLWITFIGTIIIPIAGWVIQKTIMDAIEDIKKNNQTFFKRLDDLKQDTKETYVRKDMHEEKYNHLSSQNDLKFDGMKLFIESKFKSLDDKISNFIERYDRHQKANEDHKKTFMQGG